MKILVGISGSIGVLGIHAYLLNLKSEPEVEEIRAIMTPTAARFVSPRALGALLNQVVHVDPWTDEAPMCSPPELVKGIDLYLVAPASATTLARCAMGSAETLVANCFLCHRGPTAFAPAMAPEMWEHPAVRGNRDRLREYGACILQPGVGFSAALGKPVVGALAPYSKMWPQLRSLVQAAKTPPDSPTVPDGAKAAEPEPR